jgi:hypothetical protein
VQRGQRAVVPSGNGGDASELTHVTQFEDRAVIEGPRGADVRIDQRVGAQLHDTGHPEVHDELAVIVQRDQQVLASAAHRPHDVADDLARRDELGVRRMPCVDDALAGERGGDLAPYGLDLGELGHVPAA